MARVPAHDVLEMRHCTEKGVVSAMEPVIMEQKERSRKMGTKKSPIVSESFQEALEEANRLLRSMEIGNTKMSLQRALSNPPEVSASFQAKLSQRLSQPHSHERPRKLRQQHNSTGFVPQAQMERISGNNVKGTSHQLRLRLPVVEYADLQDPKCSKPKSLQVYEHTSALCNPLFSHY